MPETLRLLHACVDADDESYLRFLYEGRYVKYTTIASGVYTADDMCFGPSITLLLPPIPEGDWNYGYIEMNAQTGQPHFAQTARRQFQGVENAWHPTTVDHLEPTFGKKLRSQVYEATSPRFQTTVVAKFARFEWEVDAVDDECTAYQWLEGRGAGPKFLGHISEEGRVIGFLMEKVANARHVMPSDTSVCSEALGGLHRLDILHGDINKHNFLINDAGCTVIDFECARKCDDTSLLETEMQSLQGQLEDTSGRGGCITYLAAM